MAEKDSGGGALQPLFLPETKRDLSCFYDESKDLPIPCLVCEETFTGSNQYLQHLLTYHKIVIHNTSDIASYKW